MKHPSFEEWLFAEEPLQPEQSEALVEHLQECADCRLLKEADQAVLRFITEAPAMAPAPGFTARWEARLAESRQKAHEKQLALILGLTALFAGGLFIVMLLGFSWLYVSADDVFINLFQRVFGILQMLSAIGLSVKTLFASLGPIKPTAALAIPSIGLGMSLIGFQLLYRAGVNYLRKE